MSTTLVTMASSGSDINDSSDIDSSDHSSDEESVGEETCTIHIPDDFEEKCTFLGKYQ